MASYRHLIDRKQEYQQAIAPAMKDWSFDANRRRLERDLRDMYGDNND
jgi:hypothetical protein